MSAAGTDHIHVGQDGWLFVAEGSNGVVGQFSRSGYMSLQIEIWRATLLERRARALGLGILYRHVVVPEKLSVYDDKLDGLAIDAALSPAHRLPRVFPRVPRRWHRVGGPLDAVRLRRICVDLVGPMRAARSGAELYFRTDSHWSFAGRWLAYRAICRACGARPVADLPQRPSEAVRYVGDLGAAFEPQRSETARLHRVQRDAARVYASPIVAAREGAGAAHTLHVGAHVVYANARAPDPRRLVLFGDSYAHFTADMLTIMLAETFREVHFVWSASVDWGYVERVGPDVVLTQIAERFMFRPPDDTFDLARYATERFGAEPIGTA